LKNIDKEINMIASIQLNNQFATPTSSTNTEEQGNVANASFSEIYNEQLPKPEPVAQIESSSRISTINDADVAAIYKTIKQEVKEELEVQNIEGKELAPFDYLNGNIDKIMNFPIEVKIEPDEVNQAIIYNSLGISYLDVKEVEVRMELLAKAKDDVNQQKKQGLIREDQAQNLLDKIERFQTQLEDKKQSLLDGNSKNNNEKLFIEQLTAQKGFNL